MAKRFAYVSFGILCLVSTYQLGAEKARADWDVSAEGALVGGSGANWFTSTGESWHFGCGTGEIWTRTPENDLPFPVDQVKFLTSDCAGIVTALTTEDVLWRLEYATGWRVVAKFPGGAVSMPNSSWGSVKERYRK